MTNYPDTMGSTITDIQRRLRGLESAQRTPTSGTASGARRVMRRNNGLVPPC